MTIDAGLRQHLVTALAGQVDAASITCGGDLPEGALYPAVTILASSVPEVDMTGPTGLVRTVADVVVLGADDPEAGETGVAIAKRVTTAVAGALHCYRGAWGDQQIKGCFLEEQEDVPPDQETTVFAVSMQFIVWHRQVP